MSDEAIKGIQRFFGRVKNLFSPQAEASETQDAPRYDVRAVPAFYEDRARTLQFIRETPLVYGYWGDFKRIFKQAEADGDRELLTALLARLDTAPFPIDRNPIPTPLDIVEYISGLAISASGLYITGGVFQNRVGLRSIDVTNLAAPVETQQIEIANAFDTVASYRAVWVLQQGAHYGGDQRWAVHGFPNEAAADGSEIPAVASCGRIALTERLVLAVIGHGAQTTLSLFDHSDPPTVTTLGSVEVRAAIAVAVEGDFAFVISQASYQNNPNNLHVIDISDAVNPRLVTTAPVNNPSGIAVVGDTIYVTSSLRYYGTRNANNVTGLTIFAWRGGAMSKLSELPLDNTYCLAVSGNYAYIGCDLEEWSKKDSGGIRIVDIANPKAPRQVGVHLGAAVKRVALRGETLFAVTNKVAYGSTRALRAFDVSNPAKPTLIGTPPSRETVAYMKRRARRVLHEIAAREPESYAAFAADVLAQSGKERGAIDFDADWLTVPILFGGGKRWQQTQHNRGRFVCRVPAFVRTRREESYPALWDKNPQVVEPLFTDASRPRETREFALRLLRRHALPVPALSDAALTRSLQSGSAPLISQAVHQLATLLKAGGVVPPEMAAEAFFRGAGPARRSVLALLDKTANDRQRNETFAGRLYALAAADSEAALTRKQRSAFGLLAARFAPTIRSAATPALTARLYATGREDFAAFAEDIFAHLQANDLLAWLLALNTLEDALRDRAFARVLPNLASQLFRSETARNLVTSPQTWVRESGWIALANSATPVGVYEKLWNDLLDFGSDVTALATAFASPAALSLLPRISFDYAQLLNALRSRPQLLEWITPQVFETLLPSLSLDGLLELIALIPNAQWANLRAACISGLQKFDRGLAFWEKVFAQVNAQGATAVSRRLLDDAELTETFVNLLDIGDLLKSANPAFGALLGRWVAAHVANFDRDSPELLTIATSRQPEIRTVGLARLQTVGMSLPFALRLLESELPDAIEAGKAFFARAEADQRLEYAVALCDSPQRSVRAYGLQYTETQLAALDSAALFARLSENPDTKVQVWVAKKLRAGDAPNADVFDRAVLRQRDKGRKAKEAVKKQRAREPAADMDLLLEMARSRTPRDAEWALQELAKLTLAGAEIPGVTLEGAAGG